MKIRKNCLRISHNVCTDQKPTFRYKFYTAERTREITADCFEKKKKLTFHVSHTKMPIKNDTVVNFTYNKRGEQKAVQTRLKV